MLLFKQSGGLSQDEVEDGLAMNIDFFMSILNALNIGDLLNEVAYQIRPYEIEAGETDTWHGLKSAGPNGAGPRGSLTMNWNSGKAST